MHGCFRDCCRTRVTLHAMRRARERPGAPAARLLCLFLQLFWKKIELDIDLREKSVVH